MVSFMPKPAALPPLPDLDAMEGVLQRFAARIERDPALAGATLEAPLRVVPGKRGIIAGRLGGKPAVFRFYLDRPEAHAERDWAELRRAWTYMSTGDHRINAPLAHAPDLGLVAVARVAGRPLMERLRGQDAQAATADLAGAAGWLSKYTAPTEGRAPVRLDGWFTRVEKAMARQSYARLRPVEAGILAEMRRISAPHAGGTWRVAICHGDFHPNNLLARGARLTAIDTGGSAKLPLYKDMARFLAHMGRRGLLASGQSAFGVDRAGLDAFATAFALDPVERDIWLPFMIGVEALKRVEPAGLSTGRIRQARRFYTALLDGLRAIPA